MNGLAGPSQLTSEKLKIRINTPVISMDDICRCTNVFITAIPIFHLSSEQSLDRVCKTAMLAPSTMTVQVKLQHDLGAKLDHLVGRQVEEAGRAL